MIFTLFLNTHIHDHELSQKIKVSLDEDKSFDEKMELRVACSNHVQFPVLKTIPLSHLIFKVT